MTKSVFLEQLINIAHHGLNSLDEPLKENIKPSLTDLKEELSDFETRSNHPDEFGIIPTPEFKAELPKETAAMKEDNLWRSLYFCFSHFQAYKTEYPKEKLSQDFRKEQSTQLTYIFDTMEQMRQERPDEFKKLSADDSQLLVLQYLIFIDRIHQVNVSCQLKYRKLVNTLIQSNHTLYLKEAFAFIDQKKSDNYFSRIENTISKGDVATGQLGFDDIDLPPFFINFFQINFTIQLLKKGALEDSSHRYELINSIQKQFPLMDTQIDTADKELKYLLELSAMVWNQYTLHSIFPCRSQFYYRQYLSVNELILKRVSELSFIECNQIELEQVRHLTKIVNLILEHIKRGEHHLETIDERVFWYACCTVNTIGTRVTDGQLTFFGKNADTLMRGLLEHTNLQKVILICAQTVLINDCYNGLCKREAISFKMMESILHRSKYDEIFKPIDDLKLHIRLEQLDNESADEFYRRYILNIFIAATSHFFKKQQIEIAQKIFESIAEAMGAFDVKLKNPLIDLLAFLSHAHSFNSASVLKMQVMKQNDLVKKVKNLSVLFARIAPSQQLQLKEGILQFLKEIAVDFFRKKRTHDEHGAMIKYQHSFLPVLKMLNLSADEETKLQEIFREKAFKDVVLDQLLNMSMEEEQLKSHQKKNKSKAKAQKQLEKKEQAQKKLEKQAKEEKKMQAALLLEKEKAAQKASQKAETLSVTSGEKKSSKKAKKKKKHAKKKSEQANLSSIQTVEEVTPVPAASELKVKSIHSFFQSNQIEMSQLPKAFLKLQQLIKTSTGKDLILTGGAVEALYLKEHHIKDYDCLLIDYDLEKLKSLLIENAFEEAQIVGLNPVLKFKLDDIDIDIISIPANGDLKSSLKSNAATRDIISTAMYLYSETNQRLELYDPLQGARFLDKKLIGINLEKDFFIKDPIRLLRVVKAQLKRRNFILSEDSQAALMGIDHALLWKDYLFNEAYRTHRGRIKTALTHLTKHFPMKDIFGLMREIGLLQGLLGIENHLLPLCQALSQQSDYGDKLYQFYLLSAAVFFFSNRENKQVLLDKWPLLALVNDEYERLSNFVALREYYCAGVHFQSDDVEDAWDIILQIDQYPAENKAHAPSFMR